MKKSKNIVIPEKTNPINIFPIIYPKVSIIITYRITKVEQFDNLIEAINSALTQTYTNLEIILVDDNTDISISEILDKKIQFFFENIPNSDQTILNCEKIRNFHCALAKKSGISEAKNLGIFHANGEYVMCLNLYSRLAPTSIERMASEIQNGNCELVALFHSKNSKKLELTLPFLFRKKDWKICDGFDPLFSNGMEDMKFILEMINLGHYRIKAIYEKFD